MTKSDINRIFANLRRHKGKFHKFKKANKDNFIGIIVSNKLLLQGIENYEDLKNTKPDEMKMIDYLEKLIYGGEYEG